MTWDCVDLQDQKLSHRAIGAKLGAVRQIRLRSGVIERAVAPSAGDVDADSLAKSHGCPRPVRSVSAAISERRSTSGNSSTPLCDCAGGTGRHLTTPTPSRQLPHNRTRDCGIVHARRRVPARAGEVRVEHGRVLLDGNRTATDDPKSKASRRTISVEEVQPGTVVAFTERSYGASLSGLDVMM